jgi:N-acetylglucosamine-6-phosphate deacetylase
VIFLIGADVVLPDRLLGPATVVIDGDRIADIVQGDRRGGERDLSFELHGALIVPGFIDVHVHGVEGYDTLAQADAVREIAKRLPRHGVTAFCPTTIACAPEALRAVLSAIAQARSAPAPASARVLPAHLESNFISPEFKGAQPLECLRRAVPSSLDGSFTGADILNEIEAARPDVAIVTTAPELDGGLDLVSRLVNAGHRVSIGHTGATYEEAVAAIARGASQATHLFNRMTPLLHRSPGVVGAVLESDDVAAELVCDGVHVHPGAMRSAIAAKGAARMMAITDGTAGSGLPEGTRSTLGGRTITVGDVARLEDGTIAGSVLTMNRAFERLIGLVGVTPVDAAIMCATTPARELGLHGHGVIAEGAVADIAVLDRNYGVLQTWIGGGIAYTTEAQS